MTTDYKTKPPREIWEFRSTSPFCSQSLESWLRHCHISPLKAFLASLDLVLAT